MNAHIDELAKQAGLHREWYIDNPEIEKFAELIIRECVQCCDKVENDDDYDDYTPDCAIGMRDGALLCKIEIKQHFGVEL